MEATRKLISGMTFHMFNRSVIFKAKYNKLGSSGLGSILDFTDRDAMGGLLSIKTTT